ncbi:Non-specific lipid-transfer protein C, cotyledon-specific isoform [Heracleum sosnowskyi]|uniref:Non-specific lipid-transfer protein n=1 Tax=Heracleum sosnowskyi TaxID=360622 RepID=A0AAD8MKQ5_9APIA|nr:Non-specific lipid-transfer protein C, cotyledon-specific isoform [Heracleum sosnowskyi]
MKNLFVSMFVLLSVLFLVAQVTEAAVSCGTVTMKAAPCLNYAKGTDSAPSAQCCTGLTALATSAKTLDDKKAICNCMKNAVKNIKGVQDKYLSQIPTACKIKINFPVSLSVNCDKIN